jgi:hypothetical protein
VRSAEARAAYLRLFLPWALRAGAAAEPLLHAHYEEMWTVDLAEARRRLRIEPAPVWRGAAADEGGAEAAAAAAALEEAAQTARG